MAHNHDSHAHHSAHGPSMGKQVMAGTLATATVATGTKLAGAATKHPLLIFGLGMVAGYFVYKYRKEIISSAGKAYDSGKDFVLQQKENLEDLVAEAKEKD